MKRIKMVKEVAEGDWTIFVLAGNSVGTQAALHGCTDREGVRLPRAA